MRWRGSAIVALFFAGCAFAGCAHPSAFLPKRITRERSRIAVPFEVVAALPVVRVRIDGGPPIQGIFDTGANALVVPPREAEIAKLPRRVETVMLSGADGEQSRTLDLAHVRRLTMGGVTLSRLDALVVPDLAVAERALGAPIDALIGAAIFRGQLVSIDYPARTISIGAGALPAPDGKEILTANFSRGVPRVSVTVGDVTFEAMLDSGCDDWLDLPAAVEDGVALRGAAVPGSKHVGLNGIERRRAGRLASEVHLGRFTFSGVPVHFDRGDARVCGRLLQHFAVTLDARQGRVRLHRDGGALIEVEAERTLGIGVLRKGSTWVVVDLIPGLAPVGIALGDAIVAVDGRPATTLTQGDIDGLHQRSHVRLELERGAKPFTIEIPVHEIGAP